MNKEVLELEGTWEEIVAHSAELAGRRVRVIVFSDEPESSSLETPTPNSHSTAQSLLKYAGTWEGDDLEECLQLVYDTRGQIALSTQLVHQYRYALIVVALPGEEAEIFEFERDRLIFYWLELRERLKLFYQTAA